MLPPSSTTPSPEAAADHAPKSGLGAPAASAGPRRRATSHNPSAALAPRSDRPGRVIAWSAMGLLAGGCAPFAGVIGGLLALGPLMATAGCGGLTDSAESEAGAAVDSGAGAAAGEADSKGGSQTGLPDGDSLPSRPATPPTVVISPEDAAAIAKLPPARSGADSVLFPPGDTDLMEPLVGEPSLADSAIVINPYDLMPHGLPITDEHRAEIYEYLVALQPLRTELTSDHHDRWFILNLRRFRAILEDDRPEVGWAALHAYTNYPGESFLQRRDLLTIGAKLSPKEATPLLAALAFNYGPRIGDRAEAVQLLAETSPETLLEGARAYLERPGRPFQTAPNDEFYVSAWITASNKAGKSPVPMMATVAMNLALEPYARYIAVEELANHPDDPLARATLREALVESSGDNLFRMKSAQSIIASFPREAACKVLEDVISKEANANMARFLDDMIQTNCR